MFPFEAVVNLGTSASNENRSSTSLVTTMDLLANVAGKSTHRTWWQKTSLYMQHNRSTSSSTGLNFATTGSFPSPGETTMFGSPETGQQSHPDSTTLQTPRSSPSTPQTTHLQLQQATDDVILADMQHTQSSPTTDSEPAPAATNQSVPMLPTTHSVFLGTPLHQPLSTTPRVCDTRTHTCLYEYGSLRGGCQMS
ncbi:hypothetical protein Pelo_8198 [Pelomyxa schiedti]|nr:hypothetical protein Pelo_8198 [Pelomyxa schiedti]